MVQQLRLLRLIRVAKITYLPLYEIHLTLKISFSLQMNVIQYCIKVPGSKGLPFLVIHNLLVIGRVQLGLLLGNSLFDGVFHLETQVLQDSCQTSG